MFRCDKSEFIYIYLFNLNIAFCACPAKVLCASENEPPAVKTIPKYFNFLTMSNGSLSYVNVMYACMCDNRVWKLGLGPSS